jgi:predicted nucleic acid-binding protein
MTTYADSSALVPLYVNEQFSDSAGSVLLRAGQIPFTVLHQLEIPNAFERLVGRDLMTRKECDSIQRQLREDLDNQRLIRMSLDLDDAFAQAAELSGRYAAKHLVRSLDLLHVAAAHAVMSTRFVSADDHQLAVAKATGLKIVDIKRGARRQKRVHQLAQDAAEHR